MKVYNVRDQSHLESALGYSHAPHTLIKLGNDDTGNVIVRQLFDGYEKNLPHNPDTLERWEEMGVIKLVADSDSDEEGVF